MKHVRSTLPLIFAALPFTLIALPAHALDMHDTVVTDRGSIVTSTAGACVRSKWVEEGDDCAPPAPPPPPRKPVVQAPVPSLEQRTVYFDFNKTYLTENATIKLDSLAQWIATAKDVRRASIIGYADAIGSSSYNQKLSEQRAQAVEGYLKEKGVRIPTSVRLEGMGQSGSVTQCEDVKKRAERITCLAADRRVEVKFEILK